MAKRIRTRPQDWEEWLRPYVVKNTFQRRKNQYDEGLIESYCYSVGIVPFGLMVSHDAEKYLKWKVEGRCFRCGEVFVCPWNNIWLRKAYKGEEVCGRCGRKEQFTDEWKKHNSEAQKKVQGTPEARERMSKRLKDAWASDPDIRKRISQSVLRTYDGNDELRRKIGDASRRNWLRAEYQEKVTGHGYHHGCFVSRCGRIYFASSWELMFLVWCESDKEVLNFKRSQDAIGYNKPNGGTAYYHPDFEIKIGSVTRVIEVKGGRSDFDLVERKRIAAMAYYKGTADYMILFKQDLQRLGILRQSKTVSKWIGSLVASGKVDGYGFGKKHS